MTSQQSPLIWNEFQLGIADNPQKGHGLFRNADIDSFPGAIKSAKKPGTYFHKISTVTFTADAGTDICTASGAIEGNNQNFGGAAVYFTTTGTLPAGLSTGTLYFLIYVSGTTFKVATSYKNAVGTAAGTQIDITDAGSGTHTMNQVAIGNIKWIVEDPRGAATYMLSSNGRVWFTLGTRAYLLANAAIDTPSTGCTNASGNGLTISQFSSTTSTFLFVFRNALIDVIDIFGTTAIEALSWSNGWKSLNTAAGTNNPHEAIKGQDDVIYFTDDRYVGSILENVGSTFAPGTGSTYTYNNQALDLPNQEIASCIDELGPNLLIGGSKFNKIYPWDRISDSFTDPLIVPEYNISKLKNYGGTAYILAGTWGNIYKTQGSYVRHHVRIPLHLTNNAGFVGSAIVTWGGIAIANGSLLVGLSTALTTHDGVWRIREDGRVTVDNQPSAGAGIVYSIFAKNDFYDFGYAGGADNFNSVVSSNILYNNLEVIAQSPLFKVATKIGKGAFSRAEIVLDRVATGGQARLGYRNDIYSTFTTIGTVTADSANQILTIEDIGLTDIDNIQLQIEMNDSDTGTADFHVIEVRLFP